MKKRFGMTVLLLAGLSIATARAVAQDAIVGFTPPPAATVLDWYRHSTNSDTHHNSTFVVTTVLAHHQDFPRAYVDSLVTGLEQIALTNEDEYLRTGATGHLLTAASDRYGMTPMPGMIQRIRRIYRQTSDPAVRSLIVASLPRVGDRATAAAWLQEIVEKKPETQDFPNAAHQAISALMALGDEGRATLRELHRNRAQILDPQIRRDLESLAREDFPVVDPRAQERRRSPEREHPPRS